MFRDEPQSVCMQHTGRTPGFGNLLRRLTVEANKNGGEHA